MPHARTRRLIAAGAALAAALALVACGNDDDATTPDPGTDAGAPADDPADDPADPGQGDGPRIADFDYADMTVAAGDEVTVTNEDGVPHSLTASDGSFDTGTIDAGGTGSFTAPDEAGDHEVFCQIHDTMSGTLTVS